MRVFVTGATGFVGTAIVQELIIAGHQVLGLARSDASAQKLAEAGAEVLRGDLEDLDSLRKGTASADGVIHAGFIHDFTRIQEVCEVDKTAIETIGAVLAGSDKPFIITSGTALTSPGQMATEHIIPEFNPAWPRVSEQAADTVAALGVRTAVVRLSPSVHGDEDRHGFIPILVGIAREKGISGYVYEGLNRWNAVHRLDAARLYRLALENVASEAVASEAVASGAVASESAKLAIRFHVVAEEAITVKSIAEAIGRKLNIPVAPIAPETADHFGWFSQMAAIDCPATSTWTQQELNWYPTHPTLLADIENGVYTNQDWKTDHL